MGFEVLLDSGVSRLMAKQLKHVILAGVLLCGSAVGFVSSSAAQQSSQSEAPLPQRNGKYYSDAVQLARLLGRAHAIRVTCNGRTDQFWRLYMQEMLDLEAPSQGSFRDSMARAFNDSYAAEASVRNWCDDAAVAAEAQYAAEGKGLAEGLAKYYFQQ